MQDDLNRLSLAMDAREYRVDEPDGSAVSDEKVQAALAEPAPVAGTHLFTSLSAGVEPEFALLRAGGASVVLAVLGRAAVGILGDDSRLILNDTQIVAMAQNGAVREYLSGADAEHDSDGAEQPSTAAQAAGAGGKE